MKIGLSIKIDVTKIDKSRLFKGDKGTYLDLTTFIELDEQDKYGNNGFIAQSQTKEERDAGADRPTILGNVKVFFKGESEQQRKQGYQQGIAQAKQAVGNHAGEIQFGDLGSFDDSSIPF